MLINKIFGTGCIIIGGILTFSLFLIKKNQILRQTIDLLLPKLISGKIDISDLEIDVGNIEA